MKPEIHQKELSKLFPDIVLRTSPTDKPDHVKTVIPREVSRTELGHFFSLGICGIKRSGAGICATFDLKKAFLNFQTI